MRAPACGARSYVRRGRNGVPRIDRPEERVFGAWPGRRVSPRKVLGESLGAASALQVVVALDLLRQGAAGEAVVTAVGGNEQVGGCVFRRVEAG